MKNPFDVELFVEFKPAAKPMNYEVLRAGKHGRKHQFGIILGVIRLKNCHVKMAVLKFPDGHIDTFTLHEIAAVVPSPATSEIPTSIAA